MFSDVCMRGDLAVVSSNSGFGPGVEFVPMESFQRNGLGKEVRLDHRTDPRTNVTMDMVQSS